MKTIGNLPHNTSNVLVNTFCTLSQEWVKVYAHKYNQLPHRLSEQSPQLLFCCFSHLFYLSTKWPFLSRPKIVRNLSDCSQSDVKFRFETLSQNAQELPSSFCRSLSTVMLERQFTNPIAITTINAGTCNQMAERTSMNPIAVTRKTDLCQSAKGAKK